MNKKSLMILGSVILVFALATTIYAQMVLKAGQNSPSQTVAARKFDMRMLGANVADLTGKIKGGNLKGIAADAGNIAAVATFLPLVYQETHTSVYPVQGSKYYY